MINYSQNNEQEVILNYFAGQTGTLLDIGANDGETLSNSRALILNGWKAALVEPAQTPFDKLKALYKGDEKISCFQCAISNVDGMVDFYSSDSHLKNGDTDLLSTLKKDELKRWCDTQKFTGTQVQSRTFASFMSNCPTKKFDFITIDAEGVDWDILKQIDLTEIGCKCLVIEHNQVAELKLAYIDYCQRHGLKLIHENYENFIFAK